MDAGTLRGQIACALDESRLPGLPPPRRGKVRDVYELPDRGALLLVTTDRISAFDRNLGVIPFKGEVLAGLAARWFRRTAPVCPNHLLDQPDPCALLVRALRPVPVEVVVRARLTGSLWRDYEGGRDPYGLRLPPGLAPSHAFDAPVVTPTTKGPPGTHDLPLSERDVVEKGLCDARRWGEVRERALALFAAGAQHARSRGLELVDTKYEFGVDASGRLLVMDEIHTPDSSRYWQQTPGGPKALDKEFLRQWLLAKGWSGDGTPPEIPLGTRAELAQRYIELFRILEGAEPELHPGPSESRLVRNLKRAGLLG